MRSEVQLFPDPPSAHRSSAPLDAEPSSGRPSSEPVTESGAVAQLGEHLLCKQGVTGSIPVSSTNQRDRTDIERKKGQGLERRADDECGAYERTLIFFFSLFNNLE